MASRQYLADATWWYGILELNPIVLLRAVFLATSFGILLMRIIPAFSSRFLAYGQRHISIEPPSSSAYTVPLLTPLLDHVATYRVSHDWFKHFYYLSTLCSIFWGYQIQLRGRILSDIASQMPSRPESCMSLSQVQLIWTLMLLQGLRRGYECIYLSKRSSSTMWIGHWLFGIIFYSLVNIAVWIEGLPSILSTATTNDTSAAFLDLVSPTYYLPQVTFRLLFGIPIFVIASGIQHDLHCYLSTLPSRDSGKNLSSKTSSKTSSKSSTNVPVMPTHAFFSFVVCPHYTCEVLIYLCLSLLAAPKDQWVNKTLLCATFLAAVNLGVTADLTWNWWKQTWGDDVVNGRLRMIPGVW